MIDSPELELVGLYVYSDAKAGRDAGEIARRPSTGVVATRDREEILRLDADVVIHTPRIQMPYQRHDADICAILASGKNVVTTVGHHYPHAHGEERAATFLDAAHSGSTTMFGVGVNPGVIGERVATALSGAMFDLDSIGITELVDTRKMPDPDFVFNVMGMGRDPDDLRQVNGEHAALYGMLYSETLAFMADALGIENYTIEPDHQVLPATADIVMAAGVIAEGTVASTEWRWHLKSAGETRITLAVIWTMEPERPEYVGQPHWSLTFHGRPGLRVSIDLVEPPPSEVRTRASQYITAATVVRAVPAVVAAPPGILRTETFLPYDARMSP
ncbi:hypothetical protein [Streptosporangium sp. NPDC087985]|uniref:hypothetical protein n=1 Tax=Streptosporangium sp. NPDC087985 TaxID=3366196 RepID=UPI0038299D06